MIGSGYALKVRTKGFVGFHVESVREKVKDDFEVLGLGTGTERIGIH